MPVTKDKHHSGSANCQMEGMWMGPKVGFRTSGQGSGKQRLLLRFHEGADGQEYLFDCSWAKHGAVDLIIAACAVSR